MSAPHLAQAWDLRRSPLETRDFLAHGDPWAISPPCRCPVYSVTRERQVTIMLCRFPARKEITGACWASGHKQSAALDLCSGLRSKPHALSILHQLRGSRFGQEMPRFSGARGSLGNVASLLSLRVLRCRRAAGSDHARSLPRAPGNRRRFLFTVLLPIHNHDNHSEGATDRCGLWGSAHATRI